jgi:hypothetical protein
MRQNRIGRRTAWALAALTLGGALYEGYGYPDADGLPDAGTLCSAKVGQAPLQAQIRYDSGRTLHYASIAAMFAQLGAQEQPGIVRSVQVRTVDGRWVDASRARYTRALPSWQAYDGAIAPAEGGSHSYGQLLAACARSRCA